MRKHILILSVCSSAFLLLGAAPSSALGHKAAACQSELRAKELNTGVWLARAGHGQKYVLAQREKEGVQQLSVEGNISELPCIATHSSGLSVAVWTQEGAVFASWYHPLLGWLNCEDEAFRLSQPSQECSEAKVYFDEEGRAIVYWKELNESGQVIKSAAFNEEDASWTYDVETWIEKSKDIDFAEKLKEADLEPCIGSFVMPYRDRGCVFTRNSSFSDVVIGGGNVLTLARTSGGNIIAGGNFKKVGTASKNGIALFDSDGNLQSFIKMGLRAPSATTNSVTINKILCLSSGKILIGGVFDTVTSSGTTVTRNGLVLLNSNGTIDTDFGNVFRAGAAVYDILEAATGVYVGGKFTKSSGSSSLNNLLHLPFLEGTLLSTPTGATVFGPAISDTVRSLAFYTYLDDNYIVFGGDFRSVDGRGNSGYLGRYRVTNIDDGLTPLTVADTTFLPSPDASVYKIVSSGTNLFVGGSFTSIAGNSQARLALVDVAGAYVSSFTPTIDSGTVSQLQFSPGLGSLIAGGNFVFDLYGSGDPAFGLARFDLSGNSGGSPATSFDMTSLFLTNTDAVSSLLLYPDDSKILVGGLMRGGNLSLANVMMNAIPQTITFGALSDYVFSNGDLTLSATATSGEAVTFVIVSGQGQASITGNTLKPLGLGEVTVAATQLGNGIYRPAPAVSRTFEILQGTQTITFPAIANQTLSQPYVRLKATSSANLPITYTIDGNSSATGTITGGVLLLTGAGTMIINATQPGDDNVAEAEPAQRTFTVSS